MDLSNLKPSPGSTKKVKRLGRGPGCGHGKNSGKGNKGQRKQSGFKSKSWSEGGQMPLQRRLPKRGFTNIFRVDYQEVNIGSFDEITSAEINPEILRKSGLVKGKGRPIKVLGDGDLAKAVAVTAHAFSKTAKEKIEKAGGKAIQIVFRTATQVAKAANDAKKN